MSPRFAFIVVVPTVMLLTAAGCGNDDGRNPADIPREELVQSGCTEDDDCPGGRCIVGIGDGLCTANCTAQSDCPDGTICTDTEAGTDTGEGVCLLSCTENTYCTEHLGGAYNCDTESNLTTGEDVRVCIDSR